VGGTKVLLHLNRKWAKMKFPKWIYVTFDREVWRIPASIVAESRAYYYACTVDGFEKDSEDYKKELEYSYNSDILIEWAKNSMNWSDVSHVSELDHKNDYYIDYEKRWTNSDMEIVYE
jgi:hypothetical protein